MYYSASTHLSCMINPARKVHVYRLVSLADVAYMEDYSLDVHVGIFKAV